MFSDNSKKSLAKIGTYAKVFRNIKKNFYRRNDTC